MQIEKSLYRWGNWRRDLRPGDLFFFPAGDGHYVCLALQSSDPDDERPEDCVVLGAIGTASPEEAPYRTDISALPGSEGSPVAMMAAATFRISPVDPPQPPIGGAGAPGSVKVVDQDLYMHIRRGGSSSNVSLRTGKVVTTRMDPVVSFDRWEIGFREEDGVFVTLLSHPPGAPNYDLSKLS